MKKKSKIPVELFTDGSYDQGNRFGGNGGYGVVMLFGGRTKKIISSPYKKTSIFRMEIKAIIRALEEVKPGYSIYIYSDCKNAVDFINNELIHVVALNQLHSYKDSELWWRFLDARRLHLQGGSSISISWVRSHNGNKYNEMADVLAGEAARNNKNRIKCKTNN